MILYLFLHWGICAPSEQGHKAITSLAITAKCSFVSFARDPHMRNGLNVQVWPSVNHTISAHCWRSGSIVCRSLASCTKSCALIWNSTITPWPNCIQLDWIQLMGKCSTVEKFSLDQGIITAVRWLNSSWVTWKHFVTLDIVATYMEFTELFNVHQSNSLV
jgi:hypothetical protein